MRAWFAPALLSTVLLGCGSGVAPETNPARACDPISQVQFESALSEGAGRIDAEIRPDGTLHLESGTLLGRACSRTNRARRRCILSQDLAVSIAEAGRDTRFALVPRGETYRFVIESAPDVCEIVERTP